MHLGLCAPVEKNTDGGQTWQGTAVIAVMFESLLLTMISKQVTYFSFKVKKIVKKH